MSNRDRLTKAFVSLLLLLPLAAACGANEDATAYIVSPQDGAVVANPITVVFGLKSPYGVAPAGVAKDNTGHHHLLIDTGLPDLKAPIPKDENHRHFGGGQTEVEIELSPGQHTLQLLLGDFAHIPHDPPVISNRITITVE